MKTVTRLQAQSSLQLAKQLIALSSAHWHLGIAVAHYVPAGTEVGAGCQALELPFKLGLARSCRHSIHDSWSST